ncbi:MULTISPECIES: ABC transporter permease [Jonquetella]|uniref:ABC-type dipeptide/oligopeptide/nickel transport system, permease component n=1 Tax=Jonquetella anthropi DSM 22815 TaxID=885272 RepID=H0UMD8_9BACT|nr:MULTISPECIES: ABC transporter permease [Jonquetella]EEX47638.1 ABC transporter, permease protein [Jonquetella anthropi E3_33 E1]EHM12611.1 ABC-type dipeptide/oligopeptide/nickel transport system, permease component [Jonquetella anthropi DSM 22815]ERL24606.1 putative oligopeptide ABC transporter, permease protein OppC [Jonquetella sp. BV3C21]
MDDELFQPLGPADQTHQTLARPRVSYAQDAWRRFKQNKLALAALVVLLILCFLVIFGPALSGYKFSAISRSRNLAPSLQHLFGTDQLGRDTFARVWVGGRVSLIIGLAGALISSVVGTIYGGVSGYFGGRVDDLMMRFLEICISIPYLVVVILLSVVLQSKGIGTLLLAMTITGWCGDARLVRGQVLQIKRQEFVLAAQAMGVSSWKIIWRHLLPNVLSVVLVSISFEIPGYIFGEAFLSYVGLGIQPPNTSWGALAALAQTNFTFYPEQLFFPALMIAITMLCFTMLGDGLRDALDPRLRK